MSAVAVIADCHLGGPGGEAGPIQAGPLLEQLDELPKRGCKHVVLLGDIFHIWVGKRAFESPLTLEVVAAFERLAARGVRIDYIEGNRDFYIGGSPYAAPFASVSTEVAFTTNGVRYLAVHGDGLNDRDRQYLFWRWLSKSLPARWAVSTLPASVARRFMYSSEARLAKTNFKHKMNIPEQAIRRYAERRLAEGHDVLLLGHFHEPRRWQVGDGEVRIVDAWFHQQHIEWLD